MSTLPKKTLCFILTVLLMHAAALPTALAARTVIITARHDADAYGNSADAFVPDPGAPDSNILIIAKEGSVIGSAYGGWTDVPGLPATGNAVRVLGSSYQTVCGAYSGGGDVTDNSVEICAGAILSGDQAVCGGYSNGGHATGNRVVVAEGAFMPPGHQFYGGYSNGGHAIGNYADISGTGALSKLQAVCGGGSASGDATDNTVRIGSADGLELAVLYGGCNADLLNPTGDVFSGNTLQKDSAVTVNGAANFEFVNFSYGGGAGIPVLDITPGISASPGCTLKTSRHDITFDGIVNGTGSLIKAGEGTLFFSGANNTTAPTWVKEGMLAMTGAGSIALGAVVLCDGTCFDVTNMEGPPFALRQLDLQGAAVLRGSLSVRSGTLRFLLPAAPGAFPVMLTAIGGDMDIGNATVMIDVPDGRTFDVGDQLQLIDAVSGFLTGAPSSPTATAGPYTFALTVENNRLIATVLP